MFRLPIVRLTVVALYMSTWSGATLAEEKAPKSSLFPLNDGTSAEEGGEPEFEPIVIETDEKTDLTATPVVTPIPNPTVTPKVAPPAPRTRPPAAVPMVVKPPVAPQTQPPAVAEKPRKPVRNERPTPEAKEEPFVPNNLTPEEIKQGFVLLFDGRSLDGWSNSGNWVLDGDALFRETDGGGLTYNGQGLANDFELRFEWRVPRGGNSGILYRPGHYEYQVLDDRRHPEGRNPRTSAGSLFACMAPSKNVTRPAGQWNSGRIVCKGNVIQHWLNGEKVVDFDYSEEKWRPNVRRLLLRGTMLAARGTKVHLQDHGDSVWYRSLRYRELLREDDIDHRTVTPARIPANVLEEEFDELQKLHDRRQEGRRPNH